MSKTILSLLLITNSCSILTRYPDNHVEEAVESYIYDQTGIEVDFTGSSNEADPYTKATLTL